MEPTSVVIPDESRDSEKGLYIKNNETDPASTSSLEPESTVENDDPVRTVHGIKVRYCERRKKKDAR